MAGKRGGFGLITKQKSRQGVKALESYTQQKPTYYYFTKDLINDNEINIRLSANTLNNLKNYHYTMKAQLASQMKFAITSLFLTGYESETHK